MARTVTLTPNGTVNLANYTKVPGGSDAHSILSDGSDSSYLYGTPEPTFGGNPPIVEVNLTTAELSGVVTKCRISVRHAAPGTPKPTALSLALYRAGGGSPVFPYLFDFTPPESITTETKTLGGQFAYALPITMPRQDEIEGMTLDARAEGDFGSVTYYLYELSVELTIEDISPGWISEVEGAPF